MRFLTKKDLRDKIRLSYATIDRNEKCSTSGFPKRVRVGSRVFWLEDEVEAWMRAQVERREDLTD